MVTLLPIEPLDDTHGALIIAAFNKHFINRGGEEDGWGDGGGDGNGTGYGYNNGNGYGYGDGYGTGGGYGNGGGDGYGRFGSLPEEWLVGP